MLHRYVFVGGLHRSGTSLVARLLAEHPQVAAISDAPVPENEGVYLQGAIPHTALHGRPLDFATDPAQHLVEGCRHDTLATRIRLEADWAPWFDPARPWRVEKSPVNLTRARLYQQLFPLAQFVMVVRHPQAVAAAMAKWTDRPAGDIIDIWLDAHDRLAADLPYLHAVMVLRYEDVVRDPAAARRALGAFLDLSPRGPADDAAASTTVRDGNADYPCPAPLTPRQADRAARWKYGDPLAVDAGGSFATHPLRAVSERVAACLSPMSLVADVSVSAEPAG